MRSPSPPPRWSPHSRAAWAWSRSRSRPGRDARAPGRRRRGRRGRHARRDSRARLRRLGRALHSCSPASCLGVALIAVTPARPRRTGAHASRRPARRRRAHGGDDHRGHDRPLGRRGRGPRRLVRRQRRSGSSSPPRSRSTTSRRASRSAWLLVPRGESVLSAAGWSIFSSLPGRGSQCPRSSSSRSSARSCPSASVRGRCDGVARASPSCCRSAPRGHRADGRGGAHPVVRGDRAAGAARARLKGPSPGGGGTPGSRDCQARPRRRSRAYPAQQVAPLGPRGDDLVEDLVSAAAYSPWPITREVGSSPLSPSWASSCSPAVGSVRASRNAATEVGELYTNELADDAAIAERLDGGDPRTPYSSARTGFASTSTFGELHLSATRLISFSSTGVSVRHGPHHSAQKSTTTGNWRSGRRPRRRMSAPVTSTRHETSSSRRGFRAYVERPQCASGAEIPMARRRRRPSMRQPNLDRRRSRDPSCPPHSARSEPAGGRAAFAFVGTPTSRPTPLSRPRGGRRARGAQGFRAERGAAHAALVVNLVDPEAPSRTGGVPAARFVAALWSCPISRSTCSARPTPIGRALANVSLMFVPGSGRVVHDDGARQLPRARTTATWRRWLALGRGAARSRWRPRGS